MPVKILSVSDMLACEKAADASGISYAQMMENAGAGLASTVISLFGAESMGNALGLVGKGNNGGDTLIALTYLAANSWKTAVILVAERDNEDPLIKEFEDRGGKIYAIGELSEKKLKKLFRNYQVLLDGIFGTGIKLPLREPYQKHLEHFKEILKQLNFPPMVVAVDCPSGMDCDTGEISPYALKADVTVCMAAVKKGLLKLPGYQYSGRVKIVDIGFPDDLPIWRDHHNTLIMPTEISDSLPARPLDAYKGTFGSVTVVGGSINFPGAPLMAGRAAFRSGTGWVTLAVPHEVQNIQTLSFPEATWIPMKSRKYLISTSGFPELYNSIKPGTTLLIGPGMGQARSNVKLIKKIMESFPQSKKVIDADGLKLLVENPGWQDQLSPNTILTPHLGEMSILCGVPVLELASDKAKFAARFAEEWNCVVVLKGPFTVVAGPEKRTSTLPVASPVLARAGTGDVLAGIIAGLLAQGMEAFMAARSGVWIHAQAGLLAEENIGSVASVLAGDLLENIPQVFSYLENLSI